MLTWETLSRAWMDALNDHAPDKLAPFLRMISSGRPTPQTQTDWIGLGHWSLLKLHL